MLILAFDTATEVATSALVSDGEVLGERVSRAWTLLEDVDALLRQGGAHPSDLEALAVGIGPGSFTGIRGVRVQDMAVQEDQRGPLSDRRREHLGASDLGVIATRRVLLRQAKALQKGIEPPQPNTPEAYHLRSLALNAPRAANWQALMQEHMRLPITSHR